MTPSLSLGRIRGLQELANASGLFTITALDHRGSLRKSINPDDPKSVTYDMMAAYKVKLLRHLAPRSSAILIDPVYGAALALSGGHIAGTQGFLVSLEATGYDEEEGDRITTTAEGWSVEKIKRMGASAVKLLLYYNPGSATAGQQEDYMAKAAEECHAQDIAFLVEPMTYHIVGGPKKGTAEFARLKAEMVIEDGAQTLPAGDGRAQGGVSRRPRPRNRRVRHGRALPSTDRGGGDPLGAVERRGWL